MPNNTIDTFHMSRDELVETIAAMEKRRTDRNAHLAEAQRRRMLSDPAVLKKQYADHAIYAKKRYNTDEAFRAVLLERSRAAKAKIGALRAVRRLFAD